jgi:NSS family neurotransmitter:Na+ symporter
LNHALGHVFFTLSVGFGTMVTFGSYLREEDHVPSAGFRVAVVDTVVSLVAVVMLFPVAFQASNVPLTDPALLFEVLPRFLVNLPGGPFFGLLFFLCLYMAALNASIGLLEVVVSNITDMYKKIKRSQATWLAGVLALTLTVLPSLSSSVFENIKPSDRSLIEGIDSVLINWILPLVVLGICLAFVRGTTDLEKEQSFVDRNKFISVSMYPNWLFMIKYVAPAIIILGFVLQIIGLLLA